MVVRIAIACMIIWSIFQPGSVAATDVERGRALAARLCAGCHDVQAADAGRHPEAPTFRDIAASGPPEALGEAFAEGVMVGHPDMPEFTLTVDEIDGLVRYLESLSPSD